MTWVCRVSGKSKIWELSQGLHETREDFFSRCLDYIDRSWNVIQTQKIEFQLVEIAA